MDNSLAENRDRRQPWINIHRGRPIAVATDIAGPWRHALDDPGLALARQNGSTVKAPTRQAQVPHFTLSRRRLPAIQQFNSSRP